MSKKNSSRRKGHPNRMASRKPEVTAAKRAAREAAVAAAVLRRSTEQNAEQPSATTPAEETTGAAVAPVRHKTATVEHLLTEATPGARAAAENAIRELITQPGGNPEGFDAVLAAITAPFTFAAARATFRGKPWEKQAFDEHVLSTFCWVLDELDMEDDLRDIQTTEELKSRITELFAEWLTSDFEVPHDRLADDDDSADGEARGALAATIEILKKDGCCEQAEALRGALPAAV